jgi:hypothetical protein
MYLLQIFLYTYFIMSSRSKMMGAGLASSSSRRVNPNLNTAGGNKKQGYVSSIGASTWGIRTVSINANGQNAKHDWVFCVNQLGGVGAGKSQFRTAGSAAKPDGVHRNGKYCGSKFMM